MADSYTNRNEDVRDSTAGLPYSAFLIQDAPAFSPANGEDSVTARDSHYDSTIGNHYYQQEDGEDEGQHPQRLSVMRSDINDSHTATPPTTLGEGPSQHSQRSRPSDPVRSSLANHSLLRTDDRAGEGGSPSATADGRALSYPTEEDCSPLLPARRTPQTKLDYDDISRTLLVDAASRESKEITTQHPKIPVPPPASQAAAAVSTVQVPPSPSAASAEFSPLPLLSRPNTTAAAGNRAERGAGLPPRHPSATASTAAPTASASRGPVVIMGKLGAGTTSSPAATSTSGAAGRERTPSRPGSGATCAPNEVRRAVGGGETGSAAQNAGVNGSEGHSSGQFGSSVETPNTLPLRLTSGSPPRTDDDSDALSQHEVDEFDRLRDAGSVDAMTQPPPGTESIRPRPPSRRSSYRGSRSDAVVATVFASSRRQSHGSQRGQNGSAVPSHIVRTTSASTLVSVHDTNGRSDEPASAAAQRPPSAIPTSAMQVPASAISDLYGHDAWPYFSPSSTALQLRAAAQSSPPRRQTATATAAAAETRSVDSGITNEDQQPRQPSTVNRYRASRSKLSSQREDNTTVAASANALEASGGTVQDGIAEAKKQNALAEEGGAQQSPVPVDRHPPNTATTSTTDPSEHKDRDDVAVPPQQINGGTGATDLAPSSPSKSPPIDNRARFRVLFIALLTIIVSSIAGTFTIFGMYIQAAFQHSIENMIDLFCIGTACGMAFAFVAGTMYDWFGPRLTVALGTLMLVASTLCFGLMFDSHAYLPGSRSAFIGLFFLMNGGAYTLDLASIITTVSHAPRHRGMICGLLKTFAGLGASFMSCVFRGFLSANFAHLMYFMTAFSGVFGGLSVVFLTAAPWVDQFFYSVMRLQQRRARLQAKRFDRKGFSANAGGRGGAGRADHASSEEAGEDGEAAAAVTLATIQQLEQRVLEYMILKVPYLKYRLPQRRIRVTFLILLALNVFMMTQLILTAYLPITSRVTLNIFSAIATVLVLLLTVLIWPVDGLDGHVDYAKDEADYDIDGDVLPRAPPSMVRQIVYGASPSTTAVGPQQPTSSQQKQRLPPAWTSTDSGSPPLPGAKEHAKGDGQGRGGEEDEQSGEGDPAMLGPLPVRGGLQRYPTTLTATTADTVPAAEWRNERGTGQDVVWDSVRKPARDATLTLQPDGGSVSGGAAAAPGLPQPPPLYRMNQTADDKEGKEANAVSAGSPAGGAPPPRSPSQPSSSPQEQQQQQQQKRASLSLFSPHNPLVGVPPTGGGGAGRGSVSTGSTPPGGAASGAPPEGGGGPFLVHVVNPSPHGNERHVSLPSSPAAAGARPVASAVEVHAGYAAPGRGSSAGAARRHSESHQALDGTLNGHNATQRLFAAEVSAVAALEMNAAADLAELSRRPSQMGTVSGTGNGLSARLELHALTLRRNGTADAPQHTLPNSPLAYTALLETTATGSVREHLELALDHPAEQIRIPINYDSIVELCKHRRGFLHALWTVELWGLLWLSVTVWATGLVITSSLFMQLFYTAANEAAIATTTYYLFLALTGLSTAMGRTVLGTVADDLMPALRHRLGKPFGIPFTLLLMVPPWMMVIGLVVMAAVPSAMLLLIGFIILSFAFGLATSVMPYAVTCFFSYEHVGLGKVYGLCLLAAGGGVAALYRGLFYELYARKAYPMNFPLPAARGYCLTGKKDCVQVFLYVTIGLNAVAGIVAVLLHVKFQRNVTRTAKEMVAMAKEHSGVMK